MPRKSRARSNGTQPAVGHSSNGDHTVGENAVTSTAEMIAVESAPEPSPFGDYPVGDSPMTSTAEMPAAELAPEPSVAVQPPKRAPKRTSKRTPKAAAQNGAENPAENAVERAESDSAAASPSEAASSVATEPLLAEARVVEAKVPVWLRPWSGGDLPLLGRLMGDPAMTVYVGGPENAKELRERHVRYCNIEPERGMMSVILAGDEQKPAGSVGYWETEADGQVVWEIGWSVLPEFQGLGVASKAASLVIEQARNAGTHRTLHAYPLAENAASNGVCRKIGLRLQGEVVLEDRRGTGRLLRFNDWCIDLFG